jgi:parallel beta-helix repeat protein
MLSGLGHESLVDWLYYHHNEKDEWLRYGAAIYLDEVAGGEIRGNVARQGMNGLQLVRSDRLRIWNNDFSFNSGLGIGMYRSSDNVIMHNRADYCVRGYVHGVYARGQDSAALLIYEQSRGNVVAYNSMSHGGDGLFLWAGQSTMDSGQGGANDNLFYGNDFSFAPTNGLEATFSRNRFVGNLVEGSQHGLWGGYSYQSEVSANLFRDNVVAIAIEHGQDNLIAGNRFDGDQTGVRLWWNRLEPSEWGYPRHRDTRSRDYRITDNLFLGTRTALRIENTQGVVTAANALVGVDTALVAIGDTSGWRAEPTAASPPGGTGSLAPKAPGGRSQGFWTPPPFAGAPARLVGGRDVLPRVPVVRPPVGAGAESPAGRLPNAAGRPPRGRQSIIVDEWGPYDWRSPRLWPARAADSAYDGGELTMRVLGPPGRWRVLAGEGATVRPTTGRVGDTVVVSPDRGPAADWRIRLEYVGGRVVAPNGLVTAAGRPFQFGAERFVPLTAWRVRVFAWDSLTDPRGDSVAFRRVFAGVPVAERSDRFLDYLWYRPRLPGFPAERFALEAESVIDLPAGRFELVAISDDAIRVWVDDRLVVDRWTPHESEVDRIAIDPGRHRLRVEYYQVGGWVELRVAVQRRDGGS